MALLCALVVSRTASAQQSFWLDATTSTAQPPADVVGANTSTYLLLGMHGATSTPRWETEGTFSFGNGFQRDAGRWLTADGTAARSWTRKNLATRWTAGVNALQYTAPFRYGAYNVQGSAAFSWLTRAFTLVLTPQATGGFWGASGQTGGISVLGSSIALQRTFGNAVAQVSAEAHDARNGVVNGTFRGASLDVALAQGSTDYGAGVKRWSTPLQQEWGYDAYLMHAVSRAMRLEVQLSRSVTDPVLATPGSFGASVGFSWRIAHSAEAAPAAAPLTELGARTPNGRHVRFTVRMPAARSVALSGSFSDWNPLPMTRKGNVYTIDVVVPAGTHQYGFLIDGETWYLPANAPGIVDDDFGRKNATLVIEGA